MGQRTSPSYTPAIKPSKPQRFHPARFRLYTTPWSRHSSYPSPPRSPQTATSPPRKSNPATAVNHYKHAKCQTLTDLRPRVTEIDVGDTAPDTITLPWCACSPNEDPAEGVGGYWAQSTDSHCTEATKEVPSLFTTTTEVETITSTISS